jgi:hypothetical protein
MLRNGIDGHGDRGTRVRLNSGSGGGARIGTTFGKYFKYPIVGLVEEYSGRFQISEQKSFTISRLRIAEWGGF